MTEMARIAGSVAAAEMLIAGIAASPAAAAIVPEDDKRLTTRTAGPRRRLQGLSSPSRAARSLEADGRWSSTRIAGSTTILRDVARRLALAGFRAVAADFLSPAGGTPGNEDAAREAIGKLDLANSVSRCRRASSTSCRRSQPAAARSARSASAGAAASSTGWRSPPATSSTPASSITARRPTRPRRPGSRRRC